MLMLNVAPYWKHSYFDLLLVINPFAEGKKNIHSFWICTVYCYPSAVHDWLCTYVFETGLAVYKRLIYSRV